MLCSASVNETLDTTEKIYIFFSLFWLRVNKKVVKEIKEICKIYDVGKKVNQYF